MKPKKAAATPQPLPTGDGREVTEELISDIRARTAFGIEKYGTALRTHNGRDALMDAYQELLDAAQYIKQLIMERDDETKS